MIGVELTTSVLGEEVERDHGPEETDDHARNDENQQPSSSDSVDNSHTDEKEDGITRSWDKTGGGRVLEAEETEDGGRVVQKSVEARELTEGLDSRNSNDGSTVGLVGPIDHGPFFDSILALQSGSGLDIVGHNPELELDNLLCGSFVDLPQGRSGIVFLTTENKDSRRFGKEMHEAELNQGWDDTKRDWAKY